MGNFGDLWGEGRLGDMAACCGSHVAGNRDDKLTLPHLVLHRHSTNVGQNSRADLFLFEYTYSN
jgi:hypothetical protein